MSVNSGSGKPDDDQATQNPGTNAGKVSQNITTGSDQASTDSSPQQASADQSVGQQKDTSTWQQENKTQPQRKPGQKAPSLGQESGTAWQESQQSGYTGLTGVQNPQEK